MPLLAAGLLLGCQSYSPTPYVSPRVTGRLVDASTREPIPRVEVRRLSAGDLPPSGEPAKGAQLLGQDKAIRSGPDGRFVLESVRDLTLLRHVSWYDVTVSFEHPGYDRLVTNYRPAQATNTAKGEPVVDAGDIALKPVERAR